MWVNSHGFWPGLILDTWILCIVRVLFTCVLPWFHYWSLLSTLRSQSTNNVITRLFIQLFLSDITGKAMLGKTRTYGIGLEVCPGQTRCAVQCVTCYSPVALCTPKFILRFCKYSMVEPVPAPCELKHCDLYLY